ncbi:MAG: integral rane sensor signal transduction histidine kinase [Eubacterium sp.]|jgi:two-component system sensor histidine kinase YesM|nr:integral rane sensor signal transduction histidine kinase [Eubacterium sp.]
MKIRAFIRKLDNIKMREKLLFSYIIVVFIPVLLVGIILSYNMRQMVVERALKEATISVDRTFSRFNESLKVAMDMSYMTRMDESLERLLVKKYSSVQEILDAYGEYTNFNRYSNLYSVEISSIKFYTHNETIIDNGMFTKISPEIQKYSWFQKAIKAKGKIVWQYTTDEIKNKQSFSLTTVINGRFETVYLGVMVIRISEEYLNNILRNEPYQTVICNEAGTIIASSKAGLTGNLLENTKLSTCKDLNDGVWDVDYNNEPSKAVVKNMVISQQNGKFKIISIVPVNVIEKETSKIALMGILIMFCSLFLAFIFISIFTNAISKRVKVLSKEMHQVAMGKFEIVSVLDGGDEIGQLSKDLETMVKSIQDLILEVYEVNNQKNQLAVKQKEIELKMLANQINPHFLFNALETIRMRAHVKGDTEIADVVKQLGKIMRRNLEIGSNLITLKSEIEMVINYLEIQKFRYGDRIEYEIKLDEEFSDYLIMPLIIQPIVENAVIHGLEFKSGPGKVSVSTVKEDSNIKIKIEDNGLGMEPDRLLQVLNSLEEETENQGRHIGLKNVHQRIKLSYGEGYGLLVHSEKDIGTKITIVLPGVV